MDAEYVNAIAGRRNALINLRIALRELQDNLVTAKATAEQKAIDEAGGDKALGANETARTRALTLALAEDIVYQKALADIRTTEASLLRTDADLENARDERRAEEWRIRMRLADALDGRGVQTEHANGQDDVAFDDVMDAESQESADYAALRQMGYTDAQFQKMGKLGITAAEARGMEHERAADHEMQSDVDSHAARLRSAGWTDQDFEEANRQGIGLDEIPTIEPPELPTLDEIYNDHEETLRAYESVGRPSSSANDGPDIWAQILNGTA